MANQPGHLIAKQLGYGYSDGGKVVLSLSHDRLAYHWIDGPFKGVQQSDLPYQSRTIGDNRFLISWHDIDSANFVSLIIDLDAKRLFSSGILGYGQQSATTLFDGAVIECIQQ